jgi:hypothetical protein
LCQDYLKKIFVETSAEILQNSRPGCILEAKAPALQYIGLLREILGYWADIRRGFKPLYSLPLNGGGLGWEWKNSK